MKFFKKLLAVIAFPIFFVLCAAVFVLATLLLIPFAVLSLFDWMMLKLFTIPHSESTDDLGEFIFSCYGFAGLLILIPLTAFDNDF